MFVNLRSRTARRNAWIVFDRQMAVFERRLYNKLKPFINRQFRKTAEAYENGDVDPFAYIKNSNNALYSMLFNSGKSIVLSFFSFMINDIEESLKQTTQERFFEFVKRFLQEHTGLSVSQINATTLKKLKKIIQVGLLNGLSNQLIADNILATGMVDSIWRANRIARTEVHTIANVGMLEASKDMNMKKKEWLAALDERTRADHAFADGQKVPIDESFMVGGEPLQYPGDPGGSGWNIINCRCATLFHSA